MVGDNGALRHPISRSRMTTAMSRYAVRKNCSVSGAWRGGKYWANEGIGAKSRIGSMRPRSMRLRSRSAFQFCHPCGVLVRNLAHQG
jgi:hypothetical protein